MLPATTDLLVVGAGPVGLATAIASAAHGVDVTVVDRAAHGANTSRAAVVHARTLTALDSIGAARPLVERGIPATRFTIRDRADVLAGGPESLLDHYAATRRPVAQEVVGFAGRLTRLATAPPALRLARNTALRLLAGLPSFRRQLAWRLSGLVYR